LAIHNWITIDIPRNFSITASIASNGLGSIKNVDGDTCEYKKTITSNLDSSVINGRIHESSYKKLTTEGTIEMCERTAKKGIDYQSYCKNPVRNAFDEEKSSVQNKYKTSVKCHCSRKSLSKLGWVEEMIFCKNPQSNPSFDKSSYKELLENLEFLSKTK
jgi:hypothetical protein